MITDEYHYTLFKREGQDRNNSIFYFSYYDENGKRHKRSTGCVNEKKARAYVNKLIAEGKFKDVPTRDLTFKEFAEQNHLWEYDKCPIVKSILARKGKYSKDLCKSNYDCMHKHLYPTFADVKLKKITKAMIDNWLVCLPDATGLSNKSVNNMRSLLYQILQVASDMGLVKKEIVLDKVKPLKKTAKSRPAFTIDQIQALFSEPWENKHAYVGCYLSAMTGMRLGEVRALTPEQIYPDHINVNASWADGEGLKTTKSGKSREVPITDDIYKLLQSIIYHDGFIFTFDGQRPVFDRFFNNALHQKMDELGISYSATEDETSLSFHSFRHFFNSRLVAAGINGEVIRSVIGHEDEEMTQHYTHLTLSDKTEIVEIQNSILGNNGA